jgi:hypothetical protein
LHSQLNFFHVLLIQTLEGKDSVVL